MNSSEAGIYPLGVFCCECSESEYIVLEVAQRAKTVLGMM